MEEGGLFPLATHTLGMVEGGLSLPTNQRWTMELTFAPDGLSTRTSISHYLWDAGAKDMHYSTYLVACSRGIHLKFNASRFAVSRFGDASG